MPKATAVRAKTKGKGRPRIPPPPVIRDEVRIERIDDRSTPVRGSSTRPPKRATRSKRDRPTIDVADVDFGDVPAATATKLGQRLVQAAAAFEAERFTQAERLLDSIDRLAPGVPELYELRALTHYRLGRWMKAIADLQRFYDLTGSVEQHPVWADCCRALRRWSRAEELWRELGDASPSAELVEEGRIVQAGGLADRGRLDEAIQLLERAPKPGRRPGIHHLRRWYALGDLYERTGDLAHSRRVFGDVLTVEPDFGDVAERVASLG